MTKSAIAKVVAGWSEKTRHSSHLDVHLDDRLADECCSEERPKRNKEMSAGDASKIEQRVRYLKSKHTSHVTATCFTLTAFQ